MSNQVNLETQNTSQNDEGAMIVQNNEVQNQNKDMKKKELIQKLRIEDLNNENNIFGNSGQLPKINRCLKHPEEDLQFYCFNKDRLLCSECLVSGKYVGSEIANLRKAADKLRGKFNTFLAEALEKFEAFNLLEEEVVNYEGEMERAISAYEEEISKLFTELRKKINTKEQELLDSLAVVRQERINEFKSMVTSLQDYKEEIDGVKSAIEDELKDLGELELCQHYLDKADIMQDLLHKNLKSEGIKEMIENQQLQDQMSLCKLQEECRSINTQLDNLSGIEIAQCQLNSKETSKPNRMPSFFSSIESDHNNLKESRDTLFLRPSTPSRSNISQKPTYLAEDPTNSGNLSKSPANNLFEKHMAKVHEIRKQTPKQEARIEINLLAPVEAKRSETRNSLMFEMKRNSLNKKFAGLSLNDNSSLLDNYKEILNKKAESKTPKTFMLSSNLTPSNKSLGSDIYSPNNLKTTSLMTSITSITSKAVDRPEKIGFDSSARHMKLDRNIYELQNAELNRRNSAKSTIRENESSKGLNIEKMFGKRKVQEKRPEPSSFVDRGMKKKLDNLSISLFK